MRIGVNALYLIPGGVGGTEIYLRNLLQAFERIDTVNEYFVFTNRETGPDLVPPRFTHVPQAIQAVNRPARLIYEQTRLAREARRTQIDVMFNPGFTAPAFPGCPNVTVFHDLQHKRHPEHFRWFDLPAWNLFLYLSVKRSTMFVADSEVTKKDLRQFYGISEDAIVVAPLGVEQAFLDIGAAPHSPEPFFLCVSTLHPHKNLENLLRAFAAFRTTHPEWRLVMTGVRGFHTQAIEARIIDLGLQDAVELTGWIERAALYDLFRRATAMVYPSTFEGFGMPVVEAMAAGLPLACSNIEPIHSIVDGAALEFAPDDMPAMTAAMERLSEDAAIKTKSDRERKSTRRPLHLGRDGARNTVSYRSRSSSWIFASVFASRYFTMTECTARCPIPCPSPTVMAREPATTTAPSGMTSGSASVAEIHFALDQVVDRRGAIENRTGAQHCRDFTTAPS